jgi:hypothetical protein
MNFEEAGGKVSKVLGAAKAFAPIVQGGFAVGQMIAGSQNRKKADAMLPPAEDPMERQLLNTVRRRRRAIETGTAATADRTAVKQMARQYGQNAFRAGGPVNTGVLAQLMNQGMQNISSQYNQQYNQALGMEQEQVGKMADVRRDLQLLKSARKSAQGEQQMQAGQQNLLATLGSGKSERENESLRKQLAAYQNQG